MMRKQIIAPNFGGHDIKEDLDLQIKIELIRNDENLTDKEKLAEIAKLVDARTKKDFLRKWLIY